jgi:hypothetical protein
MAAFDISMRDTLNLLDGLFEGSAALLIKRGISRNGTALHSNWTDHSCQRRKLVDKRHDLGAVDCELALADHVGQLNAGEHRAGGAE